MRALDAPAKLSVSPDGTLSGNNGTYTKLLGDMRDVYRDKSAYEQALAAHGADHLVYSVESHGYSTSSDTTASNSGRLIIGTSRLLPGRYGDEYAVTRGHLHAVSDRAELYHCLSGRGVMLLETVDGHSEAIEIGPGEIVHVPGEWIHRSVNTGSEAFVTLFSYAADAGQDYELIAAAGGMKNLVVATPGGGWELRPNPDHHGYRKG